VSYDNQAILKEFSDRQGITYPLIADPQSKIIEQFGVLNTQASDFMKGMAFPGFIYISTEGHIQQTFFEKDYKERYTANSVISKLFPELAESDVRPMAAPHLQLRLAQSDVIVGAGSRATLTVEVELPKNMHVYAPEAKGYKPIVLKLDSTPELKLGPVHYPTSQTLFLPAINEKMPVFSGKFKITQDVTVSADERFIRILFSSKNGAGKEVTLTGTLFYQACDDTKCFLPEKVALSWRFTAVPLDVKRSSEAIRHAGDP